MKTSEIYYAWNRATPYWDITCEWTNKMDRKTAATYYSQEFVNPTGVYMAENASSALFWISLIYVICLLGCSLCALSKGGVRFVMGGALMFAICARICWFVTVPIVFHRMQTSYTTA